MILSVAVLNYASLASNLTIAPYWWDSLLYYKLNRESSHSSKLNSSSSLLRDVSYDKAFTPVLPKNGKFGSLMRHIGCF